MAMKGYSTLPRAFEEMVLLFYREYSQHIVSLADRAESGPGSNGNEGVLHISLTSRTEASLPSAV